MVKIQSNLHSNFRKNAYGTSEIIFGLDVESTVVPLRPIHYLGSKLRMVEKISKALDLVSPEKGLVCDLFAGSGTVSSYLSHSRPVMSVDVQEYSRVICSALLLPPGQDSLNKLLVPDLQKSARFNELSWVFSPMLRYEKRCFEEAEKGNSTPICELIEKGSLVGFEIEPTNNYSKGLENSLCETVKRLQQKNLLEVTDAVITRYYGGIYFSYTQAMQIDVILDFITKSEVTLKDTLMAALLSSVSDSVNTVGKQFAQPIKPHNSKGDPKPNIYKIISKDRNISIFQSFLKWLDRYMLLPKPPFKNSAFKADYMEALNNPDQKISVIYADPPYTRDHYSRFYHVLETISLRDKPNISKVLVNGKLTIARGIYREERHQSPFCIKSKAPQAFEDLFARSKKLGANLVLSYSSYPINKKSHPRLVTIDQLEEMALRYFGTVEVVSVGKFSHSKLNKTEKNFDINYDAEQLIICKL